MRYTYLTLIENVPRTMQPPCLQKRRKRAVKYIIRRYRLDEATVKHFHDENGTTRKIRKKVNHYRDIIINNYYYVQ